MKKIKHIKKKRINNTIILVILLSALNINIQGCSASMRTQEKVIKNETKKEENVVDFTVSKVIKETPKVTQETTNTKEENGTSEDTLFAPYASITASVDVNIRDNSENGKIMGVLPEGKSLRLLEKLDNGWYRIEYYDKSAYISGDYVYESTGVDIMRTLKKVCYATEEIKLYLPHYQAEETNITEVSISALECFEIYEEFDLYYLVKTNDYIGYIEKAKIEELTGNFVVVDISDQQLKLYSDNEIVLTTPVVTGKPSSPTDQGLFEIYNITYNRYLVGPGYRSYVDIMMKYNGGEGLHDAEYHTNEDGFSHGWRNISEFGGNTYLTDGSHGCVNMPHDAVMKVSEYTPLGTKVLVKQ